jgi:hypothetical protein
MSLALRLLPEPASVLAYTTIGATYMSIGSFSNPSRLLYLLSTLDEPVWISFNGIDNHIVLLNNGYFVLDVSSNQSFNQGLYIATGQRIYAKQVATTPTVGAIYMTTFYGANG